MLTSLLCGKNLWQERIFRSYTSYCIGRRNIIKNLEPDKIDIEQAADIIQPNIEPLTKTALFKIKEALNKVSAKDIFAEIDIPPFDRSPLDGFALRSNDTIDASVENQIRLNVTGKIFSGDVFSGDVAKGCAVRIMTGAAIPKTCDCVIRQEDVEYNENDHTVIIKQKMAHNENYIFKGEDIKCGTKIFAQGTVLKSAHLAVLASLGIKNIECYRPPRIGILSTGSELLKAGDKLSGGKIYGSNDTLLFLRLKELGFDSTIMDTSADDPDLVAGQLKSIIENIDIFISTGAVSVGEKDIFHDVFKILNVKKLFWGLNMRPGGATLCGIYRNVPLFCLSGNPFAAFIGFELIVRPALAKIACRNDLFHTKTTAILTKAISSSPVRRFIRAFLENGNVTPAAENMAGQLYSLCASNCVLDIAPSIDLKCGSPVPVIML
ncbi:MAG: molybdopterin molybdotransferase MoeA [Termitinemataceae bacterium]|nr:MAG: molybdopterin molybdotransferase MoeA [Termitinemataceae bacterium]